MSEEKDKKLDVFKKGDIHLNAETNKQNNSFGGLNPMGEKFYNAETHEEVFKQNFNTSSTIHDGLEVISDVKILDGENAAQAQMNEEIQRQLAAKKAGEEMGLSGNELIQYIIHSTADISIREELAENAGAPKMGSIEYNSPKSEYVTDEFTTEDIRNQIEAQLEAEDDDDEEDVELKRKTIEEIQAELEEVLIRLSEKQYDAPYDYVKLPSLGKTYKGVDVHNGCIKVAYLNGSDEDILTNPGILTSGRFLDVLFDRKLLEPNLYYQDLLPADRDAIMLWLRSTAYGTEYPISLVDPKTDEEFPAIVQLDRLPVNYLTSTPNKDGYFEYTTGNGDLIEYQLLTVKDIFRLEEVIKEKAISMKGLYTSSGSDSVLDIMVKRFNGETDPKIIKPKLKYMRLSDILAFKEELFDHDFGVDLMLKITAPSNEVIETVFPFETHFFWPDI